MGFFSNLFNSSSNNSQCSSEGGRYFSGKAEEDYNAALELEEAAKTTFVPGNMSVSGGKVFTHDHLIGAKGQHYHGICNDFTGTVDNQLYVNGSPAPDGGHWDLDGYHGPDGTLYK